MKHKTLFMETTEISATKSASEITGKLIEAGASQVAGDYEKGDIVGLRWTLPVNGRDFSFAIPARIEPVYEILLSRRRGSVYQAQRDQIREQAKRVAWRQLLRWVEAQVAMIQTGMVEPAEVFLPYMFIGNNTVFAQFQNTAFKALPAPSGE